AGEQRLHIRVEELAAIGSEFLQEAELISRTAELAEMSRAINFRRQLIGNELGDLRIFVPGLRQPERLAELRLIGGFQLLIVENILSVVQGELVAVIEHAPAFPLV